MSIPKHLTNSSKMLLTVLVGFVSYCYLNVEKDDAYIFYTYARNIAEGNGYVFNSGEYINATTSILYTLILALLKFALGIFLKVDLVIVGHFVSAACLLIVAYLSFKLLEDLKFKVSHYLCPLILLSSPLLQAATGMETLLTLALNLVCLRLYLKANYKVAALVAGFSVLARPDSVLFLLVLAADYVLVERKFPCKTDIIFFFLPLVPWFIFSYFYFGSLLPSTLGAKLAQTSSGYWGSGYIFLKGLSRNQFLPISDLWLVLLTVLAAIRFNWIKYKACYILSIWGILYLLSYGLLLNPPGYGWYYTPLIVPIAFISSFAFENLVELTKVKNIVRAKVLLSLLWVGLILVYPIQHLKKPVNAKALNYKQVAQWLNQNAIVGSSVAANEIGVLGYYYKQGKIIDGLGLISPGGEDEIRAGNFHWYIKKHKPNYIVLNHPRRPKLESYTKRPFFKKSYERVALISTGKRTSAIYWFKPPVPQGI